MTAYYNEFDPGAAAWLRELIRCGLIADGEVDERSILDVSADDLRGFTQCHFFAGIGGWSYALRLAGWPDDRPVWTGSPPCQPFSAAGQQKGKDDERHLAPHFAALVADGRPSVLFGEQVASAAVFGKASKRARSAAAGEPEWAWLDDLFERLEGAHYACGASDIPAAGIGAPHIRQRTFFGAIRLAGASDARPQGRPGVSERTDERVAGPGGLESRLANADGGQSGKARRLQSGGEHGQQPQDGGTGRLADAERRSAERHRYKVAREKGEDQGGKEERERVRHDAWDGGAGYRPDAPDSPWRVADWLYCRDGKWRPVESGTFPLAHGVPARVGRLRGYGNAIVPQVAAEVIKAFDAASERIRLAPGGTGNIFA